MAQIQSPPTPFDVRAISAYQARNNAEMSLEVGKIYRVLLTDGRGLWWQSKADDGNVGWFPASYTQIIESAPAPTPTVPPPAPAVEQPQQQHVQQQPQVHVQNYANSAASTQSSSVSQPAAVQSSQSVSSVPSDRGAPVKSSAEPPPKGFKDPCLVTLQIFEAKDLQGVPAVKMSPTVFIYKREVLQDPKKVKPLFTLPCKVKTNAPKWNEEFKLYIKDAETEVVCLRICAKADWKCKGKELIGEIEFPLRGAVRKFDRPNGIYQWYPVKTPSGEKTGEVLLFIEFFDPRPFGGPTDVQHKGHVGITSGGGFEIRDIPQEWKQLFRVLNIKKKDLENNAEMAKEVLDIMQKAVSDGVIPQPLQQESASQSAPTPQPVPQTASSHAAQTTSAAAAPPPPPLPSGGGPKPPPPPPANTGPKPPPPPAAAQTESRSAASTGGGGPSLFDQIKSGGVVLKKAQFSEVEKGTASTGNPLADTLLTAMSKYRADIDGNDKDNDEDDWSD